MAWKDTHLHSIVTFTCPYCHGGKFIVSHPYDLSQLGELHECCQSCGRIDSIEPSFQYGAMYVAYAIGVAIMMLRPDVGVIAQVLTINGVMVLGTPLFHALSKIIWADMFFPYKGRTPRMGGR